MKPRRTQIFKSSATHERDLFTRTSFFSALNLADDRLQGITAPSDDLETDIKQKAGVRLLQIDFWAFVAQEAKAIQWGLIL